MKEQFDSFFLIRFWFQKKKERIFGCLNSQKVLASFCIEWSQSWNVRYLSLVFSLKITACNRSSKNVLFKGTSDQCFNNQKLLLSVDRPSISKHFPSLASSNNFCLFFVSSWYEPEATASKRMSSISILFTFFFFLSFFASFVFPRQEKDREISLIKKSDRTS